MEFFRSTLDRTAGMNIYKSPKHTKQWSNSSTTNEEPTPHYQVPRTNSSNSGSDENSAHIIDLSNPPFSPNHYELGPTYIEGSSSIYENTTFDESGTETKAGTETNAQPFYQNMDFKDRKSSKSTSKAPDDEEYINPEEFIIDEAVIRASVSGPPTDNTPKGVVLYIYQLINCILLTLYRR